MRFPNALTPIAPVFRLADGTEYRFTLSSEWAHEWEPEWQKRKLVIPRGKKKDKLLGFRLMVEAKWSAIPKAEKKPSGGSWSELPGYEALTDLHHAGTVNYAPWGTLFHEMIIDSDLGWKKKRRYDKESGAISMVSVNLYAETFDIAEGGV